MSKIQILKTLIFLLFTAGSSCFVHAQKENNSYRKVGVRSYVGSVFVHSEDVENTSGARPYAIDIEWSKRFKGQTSWDLCRCYPTTGFVLGYQNYDNEILGSGAHVAYFVQYHFLQTSRLSPFIRGTGGVSYNSNPHDFTNNPHNESYSLPVNFSLQFAGGIEFQWKDQWIFDLSTSFNHISNGGLEQPNKGINWISLGLGAYFVPNFTPFMNRQDVQPKVYNDSPWFRRFEIYGSALSRTFEEKERFLVFGSTFLMGYYLSNLHSLLGGIEWNMDQSLARKIEVEELNKNHHRISVNVGHEFILGDFRFSQKIGAYVFDQLQENDRLYHKWGIAYLHDSGLLFGVEVKAHRHVAEMIVGKVAFQF